MIVRPLKLSPDPLPDSVYLELVSGLFSTLLPLLIMGTAFASISVLIGARMDDALFNGLAAAGVAVAAARLAINRAFRHWAMNRELDVAGMRRWEHRYAAGSFAFASLLGLAGARAFAQGDVMCHMLVTGLVFGYGSGVVARASIRPLIVVPSLLLAVSPIALAIAARGDGAYLALSLLIATFALGSFESIGHIHRNAVAQLMAKRELSSLARFDPLTGLPNRLYLRERLDGELAGIRRSGGLLAVHYLDLDQFKAVNDHLGHPVGDALLKEVSARLQALLRPGDFAARLGGDEFLVVQAGLNYGGEAEMLAQRLIRAVRAPYRIGGHEIQIGTSVGVALAPNAGAGFDDLIAQADGALYDAKSRGRNRFAFHRRPDLPAGGALTG